MTSAASPMDHRPIIALFCTRGMEAFLSNALKGILRVGIDAVQIVIGCPDNALDSISSVARSHSNRIRVMVSQAGFAGEAPEAGYADFGSRTFSDISWSKVFFVRSLIELHSQVIYADLDISWIRNPLPYLIEAAHTYPMAFQTEGLPRFPPALCCGFVSFTRSEKAIAFLDALIEFHATQVGSDHRLDDQAVCQQLIENDLGWLRHIHCLPESLFPNGLGYRTLQNAGQSPCAMEGGLLPFLFHANWTIGVDNKRKLLAATGTWLLEDSPATDAATTAPTPSTRDALDAGPREKRRPLLTVVYPIFDVRGDPIERIRLWTEEQELDPQRYRVFVVAGAETQIDENRLREVFRPHDVFLRSPGIGCDADCWNTGAHAATTPWVLFVEAHGVPGPQSLSALAEWIEANPDGQACNFPIRNLEHHRMAGLLKRWFGEMHASWAAPSTWRRIHRTACAIRRDVFEDAGSFEPQYGQFAVPLLSARLHERGVKISALAAPSIVHDDSVGMSGHHDDTADFVRGELDARADNDPAFFERYFGPSPLQGPDMVLPARHARSMVRCLLAAACRRPGQAFRLLKEAAALLPAALLSLRNRARLLAALTRIDEYLVMHFSLPRELRWKRFLLAHRRVVRSEQMLWTARHPPPPLQAGPENRTWPIDAIGPGAIVGLHALEHLDGKAFRWSNPAFMLRLAPAATVGTVTLETRNVRGQFGSSDIIVVAGARVLTPDDIAIDEAGNIKLSIGASSASEANDVAVIVPELSEPSADGRRGRRLGLPLFSVDLACMDSGKAAPHDAARPTGKSVDALFSPLTRHF